MSGLAKAAPVGRASSRCAIAGKVPLLRMLDRDVVAEYAKMRTGEKVLIVPHE